MSKPRILIFIDWFLPGYKAGGPIQSCANLVEHLKNDFDFWVITRDTDYCETEPYSSVKSDTWNQLAPHLQVFYSSAGNLKYSTLTKAAKEAKADVLFVNGVYSFYFSIMPLRIAKKLSYKTIVSARGMLAPSAIQVKGGKKKIFLKMSQLLGLYKGVSFHATNEAEKEHIKAVFGSKQEIKVAPNFPKTATIVSNKQHIKEQESLRLVYIARISPEKNTLYALEVLKEYTYNGNIVFDIYGPIYNESYWSGCEQLIKALPSNIEVNYKGSLESQRVHETLQDYHALFMPTRGENFGHVILESLSAGRPVIISDQTPWKELEGLGVGFDISLSEPYTFANKIQYMLDHTQQDYNIISEAAYLYAKQYVQDSEAVAQNLKLFKID
ncbi:glycosyltransferase family 4 protein [Pontibacter populi]|uniref:Glycosyltransferase n=1 Tax=Pontibacter populi TaxID=890055 RepID=A0ABV1RV93_9BACT